MNDPRLKYILNNLSQRIRELTEQQERLLRILEILDKRMVQIEKQIPPPPPNKQNP